MPLLNESKETVSFYVSCMRALHREGIPFLIGGTYGLHYYTGINRNTKDLDLFVRPNDVEAALEAMSAPSTGTEVLNRTWLAKAYGPKKAFIDIIFRAGNGLAEVDEIWFDNARHTSLFDVEALVVPPEEMIWSKAFTMERERFDLADILHIILEQGGQLDWPHLVRRFEAHWHVLLVYLILFRYSFPSRQRCIPEWVIDRMTYHLRQDQANTGTSPDEDLCWGTLLSGAQFLQDINERGFEDARFAGAVDLSKKELRQWREDLERERREREQKSPA